ncbi:MAG: ABC transporter permease [Mycobacteriaceae bacterium]|nr:ABC transporter permease [Mycobacteriaceae bacterium]
MSVVAERNTVIEPASGIGTVVSDGITIAKRNLIKIKRVPDLLVFTLLSPIMFVLLFAYIFGSSIEIPGMSYREFLIAGIFAQTVVFGSTWTGLGLAQDMEKGIIDRFRSLPMAPSAVLFGRTISDVVINVISVVVMALTGLAVGWRIRGSFLDALIGFGLLLLFAYALSWVMAVVGLVIRTPEIFNNASFMVIFPLTFIANTFVQPMKLPTVLRVAAEWNPISALTQATRVRFGNTGTMATPDSWPLQHPELTVLMWTAAILIIFVPLAIRQYQRTVSR